MSGSLHSALCAFVQASASGLWVFKNSRANRGTNDQPRYPVCIVTKLSGSEEALGVGHASVRTRDVAGKVVREGDLYQETTSWRLTFSAPDDRTTRTPGDDRVHDLRDAVKAAVRQARLAGRITLNDPETNPATAFPIRSLRIDNEQNLEPQTDREPTVYRCTLSLVCTRALYAGRAVSSWISNTLTATENES